MSLSRLVEPRRIVGSLGRGTGRLARGCPPAALSTLVFLVAVGLLSPPVAMGQQARGSGQGQAAGEAGWLVGSATLLGLVESAETGRPLREARVRIVGLDRAQLSNSKGNFRFESLPEGTLRLMAEYLGYRSDTVRVALSSGATTFVTLSLQTEPVELPELTVNVQRLIRNPQIVGFYERRQRGIGHFIGREQLERRDIVSALRLVPGVRVEQCLQSSREGLAVGRGIGAGDDPSIGAGQEGGGQGAFGSAVGPASGSSFGTRRANCYDLKIGRGFGSTGFNARCVPEVWIDGQPLSSHFASITGESVFERVRHIPRHMIEGIEVYRNAALAPAQFKLYGGCGILLVWTRRY